MGLLSTEVEMTITGLNVKYLENLGYKIPRYYNDSKKGYFIKNGTKIFIRVQDLRNNSYLKVDVECDHCHKKYSMSYKNYLRYLHEDGHIYCAKCACLLFKSGKNHYKWKDDKTDEERISARDYPEYYNFVRLVLKRDDYTCQCCGATNCKLIAHHLNGYNWFIEGRVDISNGITLCENCHENFHSIYGKGDNTKEQFEEWIGKAICLLEQNIALTPARQIYCIEEDKIYSSATDLANQWNLSSDSPIYDVCNHVRKMHKDKTRKGKIVYRNIGCHTVKGKHLLWYDEYQNMTKEELNEYMLTHKYIPYIRKVICITTGQVFNSIREAQNYYNARLNISDCCRGKSKSAGKLLDGTRLVWMYYEDYLEQQNNVA